MQLRIWIAATLFVGSYFPLAIILLVQDFDYSYINNDICIRFWAKDAQCILPFRHPWISISIFGMGLICFLVTFVVLSAVRPKRSITILTAKYVPTELMNYTLPYVVSFMGVGYQDTGKFLGVLVFLFWIFLITHRSGQIILNPVLIAFGWRLYDITYSFAGDNNKQHNLALAKGYIDLNNRYKYKFIQDVMIINS